MYIQKSIIALHRKQGKIIILQSYDVAKFFDKEMIEDGILTCLKRGADPKAVRLWYKLNSNTRIQVRTGAGLTKFGEVGAVVGQGMIGGALISQLVLDDGVMEHLPPPLFQEGGKDVWEGPMIMSENLVDQRVCI